MITTDNYLSQAQLLLDQGKKSDGCTTPFKTYIHRWLKHSRLLCSAHDFGSLGFIKGVRGGWHNNLHTLIAHWSYLNPAYWIWGTIVALITLPWVVWRRDLGITSVSFLSFHVAMLFISMYSIIFYVAD